MFLSRLEDKTDEHLMQLIARRDAVALTVLYRRYSRKLLRYFFRMLWQDEAKAQDFLQDLFLKILERPANFNTDRKFSTWVYSVANNMCKNEYRRQALRDSVSAHVAKRIEDKSTSHPMEALELKEHIESVLINLDEEERHLYALRYELELPVDEIAVMFECPEGTVKSRLFYLKKKLALKLGMYYAEKVKYGTR
jgi:RNA polymerase sigma-70 factor, ECF subfamily